MEKIKLQSSFVGDGTRVSTKSLFLVLSVAEIMTSMNINSQDLPVLCIVKAPETYNTLAVACRPLFDEVNCIVEKGYIPVIRNSEPAKVTVQTFVGSDLKFLNTIYGLC